VGTAHYQANLASKLTGTPNFSILDDPRTGVIQIVKSSTQEFYLPPFVEGYKEVKKFNALKEWSYLSPTYFQPDESVLSEYALEKKKYIFIREVSTETSNYLLQERNLVLKLSSALEGQRVILSLENKAMADQYPSHWTILEEPVSDIHSLMYYANLVISSGDSMAREGGMLGVPSIYLGNRDMPANKILMEKGILFRKSVSDLPEFVHLLDTRTVKIPEQDSFRNDLLGDWVDVNQFINSIIKRLKQD
jgi:predicted glycosyltransferase